MSHIPVLSEPFISAWVTNPEGCYIDCTFGRGGHAKMVLNLLSENGSLLAIDRDPEAIGVGKSLQQADNRFHIVQSPFSEIHEVAELLGWHAVDGIGFDLGVSSPQFDTPSRGFSFVHDGPLDMRMDCEHGIPLSHKLAHISEKQLADILRQYGNERFAGRIAKNILHAFHQNDLHTTQQLENICFHSVPKNARYGSTHPATRTFQALRIWVNDEMGQIERALNAAMDLLKPGGRLAVISFHSGEDRLVRDLIEKRVNPCQCPPTFPICACGLTPSMHWISKKPIRPSEDEITANPRSRSSMLRVAEKNHD
ncbi:MAG: 16S rRNA (cytosine(1402)-N(4))-methyltransferase RsmH [Zetaproteobacteria bacterium]|nr:16S rRNA (cytosine(1402)-N(4))-methyltransferase RsmH [Zetaproteobacteria bacterium]